MKMFMWIPWRSGVGLDDALQTVARCAEES